MKTLSSRTGRSSTSRPSSSDPETEASAESAESSGDTGDSGSPGSSAPSSALSRAGTLARAGLSALGAGLLALARGAGALGRRVVVVGRGAAVLGRGAGRITWHAGVRIRRWRIPERFGRAALAVAASSALAGVRIWLLCRVLFASRAPHKSRGRSSSRASRSAGSRRGRASARSQAPAAARLSRRSYLTAVADLPEEPAAQAQPTQEGQPSRPARSRYSSRSAAATRPTRRSRPPVRLTARGAIVIMFGTCFAGLLLADWTDWAELADAVFFMASSLTVYYTRPGSLLPVAVSPPLLFFVAMTAEKFLFAAGALAAFEGTLVMLASAVTWLFAGTALTLAIALLRGLPREIRALVLELRG